MNIDLNLETANGAPAQALAAVIEARRKELGETAMQSCIAMAEGILRSLRSQTKVAKEGKMDVQVVLADDRYYPSFKRQKGTSGKNISRRILRSGKDGTEVTPERVVWRVGKYMKGEVVHSYEVTDTVSADKVYKYIVVAPSQKDAQEYAKNRHKARVRQYKGLARLAISLAMKAVYDKGAANLEGTSDKARDVATRNTQVQVSDTGINSGTASVYVHDNLEYAVDALKDGENSVNAAVNAAIRKAMGYIMHKVGQGNGDISRSLKTTVEELIGAQA